MSVALYVDEQVQDAITRGLRSKGIDVLTAQEDGHDATPDPVVLDRAAALGRVTFTQDADFLVEAHARQLDGRPFAGVVYAHQLSVAIGDCIRDLETVAVASEFAEWTNRVEYLPL